MIYRCEIYRKKYKKIGECLLKHFRKKHPGENIKLKRIENEFKF